MDRKLFLEAISKFLLGVVLLGVLLFWPAGTIFWPGGIRFMLLLFVPMFIAGLIMLKKSPELLRSRLDAREKEKEQSLVVKISGLMFLVGFILAGLSYRNGWLLMPEWLSIVGCVLFLLAYALYAEVLRENVWLSRTIEVQENQKVVDTGLYGIVRHPMYSTTLLLFFSMPLILGSALCLLVFMAYPFIIVKRLKNEEKLLEEKLEGYVEYKQKVRYRLLPFVW